MVKVFCDVCEVELNNENKGAALQSIILINGKKAVLLNVTSELDTEGILSDADICKYCVIDAINRLDDRPKIINV